uniref:39S ribosomal protein L13, mitochondrial n=1 Tax=Bursaphelenchus xylophilus TaxID=6326 RepID=A0A1I7S802_BURXY
MTSRLRRVNQWLLFSRQWHVIDGSNQDVFALGDLAARHLSGKWKPIYHPLTDCGDNVVIINCKDVAMHAFNWKHMMFHFNKEYPKSKNDIPAFEIHEFEPTRIAFAAVYKALGRTPIRRSQIERLHLFADDEMPEFIRKNIGNQLRQVQKVPKKSTEYTDEERANFPLLFKRRPDHLLDWENPPPVIERHESRK